MPEASPTADAERIIADSIDDNATLLHWFHTGSDEHGNDYFLVFTKAEYDGRRYLNERYFTIRSDGKATFMKNGINRRWEHGEGMLNQLLNAYSNVHFVVAGENE